MVLKYVLTTRDNCRIVYVNERNKLAPDDPNEVCQLYCVAMPQWPGNNFT